VEVSAQIICAAVADFARESGFAACYIFGSFGQSARPADIDLLLVYDPRQCDAHKALRLRGKLRNRLKSLFEYNSHVLLFSSDEAATNPFILDENCRLIFQRDETRVQQAKQC
jgi:predicted nucleotidyltransferase